MCLESWVQIGSWELAFKDVDVMAVGETRDTSRVKQKENESEIVRAAMSGELLINHVRKASAGFG